MRKGRGDSADINISPLIDMVFILLIFFIVTTVFVEEDGLGIETPNISPIDKPPAEAFIIHLSKGGVVYHEGVEIGYDGVVRSLRRARAAGGLESVTIEVDRQARVSSAARLLDLCKEAEVEKVSMKTSPAADSL
ncbi:transport energizing protein, ExbD/TolR family [Verrucomicrobiia bacterium DG1235]|nr:transport energizing protein, ExbD/TolR family [Verrucomicrobiae bacterium DG1235]